MIEVRGAVVGGKELARAFRALPEAVQKKVIMSAARSTGRLVAKDFDAVTPRGPRGDERSPASREYGAAHEKLTVSKLKKALGVAVHFRSAFYMRFYEFGTSHQPARPTYRPLWDSKLQEYLQNYVARLARGVQLEARKIASASYARARRSLGVKGKLFR